MAASRRIVTPIAKILASRCLLSARMAAVPTTMTTTAWVMATRSDVGSNQSIMI